MDDELPYEDFRKHLHTYQCFFFLLLVNRTSYFPMNSEVKVSDCLNASKKVKYTADTNLIVTMYYFYYLNVPKIM